MFYPIYDKNPLKRIGFQYATVGLIALNVLVYLLFQARDHYFMADECREIAFAKAFGVIPLELLGTQVGYDGCAGLMRQALAVPEPLTLLTYMFLHGDILHLAGNMLFLWVFGDNVEDAMGPVRFVVFFLICGVAAAGLHTLLQPDSTAFLIGASGAVSGVIAAYLMLHPRVHLWVLVLRFIPIRVPAYFALGAWIVLNVIFAVTGIDPSVAWWAHIGGLVAGALLILVMRRRGVELLSDPPSSAA